MTQARLPLWFLVANWAIVFLAFIVGVTLGRRTPLPDPQGQALQLVYEEIERSYVDRVDGADLLDRAIGAMARLDDYSPIEGGPGDRAGLEPGDRIVAVDGMRLDSMAAEDRTRVAPERLRGASGSKVTIAIVRGAEQEREFTIERAALQKRSVKWTQWLDRERGLAYSHLADFHVGVAKALQADLDALRNEPDARLQGLVLDLRFDLGGNLDEAIAIARMFVRDGNLVSIRRRDSEVVERFDADATKCTFPDLPLVLLVNESSASASEVLAGALQDHGRARIVGEATYGKGVVNTIYEWKDLPFRLKLTTARYFTPKGRNLDRGRHRNGDTARTTSDAANAHANGGGVSPDRAAPLDGAAEESVRSALADFMVAARHREAMVAWTSKRSLRAPGILSPSEDPQLAAALDELRNVTAR
jgi:C-terminal peptidase prc